ncbi:hypothetical protein HZD78_21880 [Mycobacteroides chelonae]|uniref:hypothetical protein n=1 Tax=Mycobacteroides TaxID=670516 RepID=UPI000E6869A6|nr:MULTISPECIES: hypothetical protein [Mycobacteroides]MBN7314508.1 hypothetical protein [Mycobacteroides abscessus subsp. abscessus]MBV6362599.1 hypothetical protein [Mycobacteroides chelonae]RIU14693.1 hypothetical protein D2F01_01715 [Mycobacteroides abscessus]
MSEIEPPLTAEERLTIVALYAGLTSKDVLHQRQHPDSEKNKQVGQSHILVSHHLSHNQSHGESA